MDELEALLARLQQQPRLHDFFATLRRLEGLHPQAPRLGHALRPAQEPLRLGQEPDLNFAPAALHALERPEGLPPRLRVLFFGLLGPQGPMPLALTEQTRERLRHAKDPALSRFLDLFHHRLLLLFYRAWAQNQPAVQHDRPATDRFAAWLGACTGLAGPGAEPERAGLFQAGLLNPRSRHPEGLAKLLTQRLGLPVRIEEHVPQWLEITPQDRQPLGFATNRAERDETRMARLGESASSGRRRLDRQYRFRIVVQAPTRAAYERLLPGTPDWQRLQRCVSQYAGLDLRWELRLVLAAPAVKPAEGQRPRLGVASWIGRGLEARERGDLRLRPQTSFLVRRAGAADTADAADTGTRE